MVKGRKLRTSLSERYLGSYNYSHGNETVNEISELGEDDVWSTVDHGTVNGDDHLMDNSRSSWGSRAGTESNGSLSGFRGRRGVGGLSVAFDDSGKTMSTRIMHQFSGQASSPRASCMATSAPVSVPDWSKIYRVDSGKSFYDSDDGVDDHEAEMVPPHEYLARGYGGGSHKPAANSIFEGVGRTLKGRDMSRVRDAVWSQTGFDG